MAAEFEGVEPRQWGLSVKGVVTRGSALATARNRVALTLDACGGPGGTGYDADLIELLRDLQVPATLFLNARWARVNPRLTRQLAADPLFDIQAHGLEHKPLSVSGRRAYGIRGTRSVGEVYDEVAGGNAVVEEVAGTSVRWFRPGTAYADEVAAAIARRCGTPVVGFSVNADGGATLPAPTVAAQLGTLRAGGITLGHMNRPGSGTAAGHARALPELLERGLVFSHLRAMV